ncbi:MAG: S-layer homology domain-containing protein, partial [Symbiobacteriaceae bacterium]|nr:S-layer homology domain-containing protein [Symbiobacteriaceae bacterium]
TTEPTTPPATSAPTEIPTDPIAPTEPPPEPKEEEEADLQDLPDGTVPHGGLEITWENPFDDIHEEDWFFADVIYAYRQGLMVGLSNTKFAPALSMTRGMIVTVMHRLAGSPEPLALGQQFSDVEAEAYYHDAVLWAQQNGLAVGLGAGIFAPEAAITRQDLAVFLCRIADYLGYELPQVRSYIPFVDEESISDYALSSIIRLYEAGIFGGRPGHLADPQGVATRGELAALLHRFVVVLGIG